MRFSLTRIPFLVFLFVGILLGAVCYVIYIARSSPGREVTVDEVERPKPKPPLVVGPLEPLHTAWDSESSADWPVAELLASMSEAAYLPPVDAEPTLSKFGFKKVTTILDSSMAGYVATTDDVAVVVFRGTDNDIDWIVNLAIGSMPTPKGPVHKGFYTAYQPLKQQIVKLIKAANPKHLWITGHSLGGALAVICAYDLIENEKLEVDGLITFGQPMVAKPQLSEHLDGVLLGRFAHYVNGNDIVARVPPNFSHFGSLVWFADDGIKRSKPKRLAFARSETDEPPNVEGVEIVPLSEQEFKQLQKDVRSEREKRAAPNGEPLYAGSSTWVQDHDIRLYLEKIRGVNRGRKATP